MFAMDVAEMKAEMKEMGLVEENRPCKTLEKKVLDYGHQTATDQMRASYKKLTQHVGTTYGKTLVMSCTTRLPWSFQSLCKQQRFSRDMP
jgi:hypothetical protein